jgi:hypothetical protein
VSVRSDRETIALLPVLVARISCGVFISIALSYIEQLSHGDAVTAVAPELGTEWLVAAAPSEAVDHSVGADAA